nr:PREDICTED: uncharacterized protein LOC109035879 isoform X2 [Bemisia tabaci]
MILIVILSAASLLVGADAKVIPDVVRQKVVTKSAHQLLNDLQVLENDRKAALKKALEDFKADSHKMEPLSVLSLVDSLFVEYRNYYNAMNTLIHSDEKSAASHQALETIKKSREQLVQLYKTVTEKQEKLQESMSTDSQMNLLETLLGKTLQKNDEIEAQLRVEFNDSPFINNWKNMPDLPNVSPL